MAHYPTPDEPDHIIDVMMRLKDIFQEAAAAPTGTAQPLFQKLSDVFCGAVDKAAANVAYDKDAALYQMVIELQRISPVTQEIEKHAATNAQARHALSKLRHDVQQLLFSLDASGRPPVAPPPKPPRWRPPAGGGDFDL